MKRLHLHTQNCTCIMWGGMFLNNFHQLNVYQQIYYHQVHVLGGREHVTSSIYGWLYSCLPFSCEIYQCQIPDIISFVPELFVLIWGWVSKLMIVQSKSFSFHREDKSRKRKQFKTQNKQACIGNAEFRILVAIYVEP